MAIRVGHRRHILAVENQDAQGAIVVDRDAGVIRVVGSDPAEVRKARAMLELRREVIQTPDDKTRRILIGKGGKNIDDIQRRSGAMSIDVDHDKGRVVVLGNASATAAASTAPPMAATSALPPPTATLPPHSVVQPPPGQTS